MVGDAEPDHPDVPPPCVDRSGRARAGEAKTSSKLSRTDISSGRRGGLRSGTKRPKGRTKEQLYNEAKQKNVKGRSKMNKAQLARAVGR